MNPNHAVFQLLLLGTGPRALYLGGFIKTIGANSKVKEFHIDLGATLRHEQRAVDAGTLYQALSHTPETADKYAKAIANFKLNVKPIAEVVESLKEFMDQYGIGHIWSEGNIQTCGATHWQIFMDSLVSIGGIKNFEMITSHNTATLRLISDEKQSETYISCWSVKEKVEDHARYIDRCLNLTTSTPVLSPAPIGAPAMPPIGPR